MLAREAVKRQNFWEYHHTLASVLFSSGEIQEALSEIRWLAEHIAQDHLNSFMDLCIAIAKNDYTDKLLEVLLETSSKEQFEPLIVALQITLGNEPRVAQEVLEVAKDIHEQITGNAKTINQPIEKSG